MFTQETASSSEEQRSTLPLEPMYTTLKLDKSGELNARHVSFIDELDGKKLIQIVGRLLLHVTAVTLPGRESKFRHDFSGWRSLSSLLAYFPVSAIGSLNVIHVSLLTPFTLNIYTALNELNVPL